MKADVSVLSRSEIETAIHAFTDAQWIRLHKAAGYFAWVYGLDGDDLLQEVFVRALAGSRHCPTHVDLVKFLVEAMRSIANGEAGKFENCVDSVALDKPGVPEALNLRGSIVAQDEVMMTAENEAEMRRKVLGLFPDDPEARDMADGILAGYEGKDLRQLTELDETSYSSKRRFMRRTIDKHLQTEKKK